MRCSYRCNMWCNCKKPAKPYPTTPSITGPSVDNVDVSTGSTAVFFTYTPADATLNISFSSTDGNIAYADYLEYSDGQGHFTIYGGSGYGNATVTYINNDNLSETYSISATRVQPEPFNPTNSIYVTKETPGEAVQTKAKKSRKKTLATAVGEEYQARIFAVDSSSVNYVLMKWVYGGDAYIDGYYGNANNEYTTNLFNDQAMLNEIAREIEDYDDRHLLGDNVTKFSDATWIRMENYFDTEFSPELAEQVQGYIIENGGTRFVTPYFNPEISDTVGNDGEWITIRGWLPAEGGTFFNNPQTKLLMGEVQHVSAPDHNVEIQYRLLGTGTSIAGYESASGYQTSIEITSQDSGYIWPEFAEANDASLSITQYVGYSFTYTPTGASVDDLNIYSMDTNVFTVSDKQGSDGVGYIAITGQNAGSAELHITTLGGGLLANPTITVTPFVHVETIGAPSVSDVTLNVNGESAWVNVTHTPENITDISQDVTLYIDDDSIANIWWGNRREGTIGIHGVSVGTTQVHYYLNSDPETVYDIDVTVNSSSYTPGENTVFYYPFTSDEVDVTGLSYLSGSGTPADIGHVFNIVNKNDCTVINSQDGTPAQANFISAWIKWNESLATVVQSFATYLGEVLFNFEHNNSAYNKVFQANVNNRWPHSNTQDVVQGIWYHFAVGYDTSSNKAIAYINGQKVWEELNASNPATSSTPLGMAVNETLSDLIGESQCWTDEQVSDYYEATKDNYPIPTYTVQFATNNPEKGLVDVGEINNIEINTPVVVNGNEITIGEYTITATAEQGNFFFNWFNAPQVISEDITITANFFAEGETPTISYALGTVTSVVNKSISVPGYKVSQIEFSGTTNNMGTWSGIRMPVKAQDGNDWFGTYIQLGSNEGTYDSSFHNEIKKDGGTYRGLTAQNYGLGRTSTSFHSTLTKDAATYTYGEYVDTCTFSDYSGDYANWVKQLLARTDLIASISPTSSTFENANIVVQYEPVTTVTQLDNVPQTLSVLKNIVGGFNFNYSPVDADIVDIDIQSNDENVVIVTWQQASNGQYDYTVSGVEDGQTTLSVYLNGTLDSTIDVTVSSEHVQTLNGFVGGDSTIVGQGYNKYIQLDISPNPVSNVSNDITLTIDDDSIATIGWSSFINGIFTITGVSEGTTQVHAYLNSNPRNVYDLDVEVTPPFATYALEQDLAEDDNKYSWLEGNPQFTTVGNADCMLFDNSQIIQNYSMLAGLLDGTGDFSVNLWVNPTNLSADYNNFFEFGTGSSYTLAGLMYHSGTLWISGYQNDRDTGATLPLNQWSMITLTHSQGTANVYVNGTLVYTDATMNWDITNGGHFVLGGSVSGTPHYYGYMNALMVTNQVVDAQTIANAYAAGQSSHIAKPISSISNVASEITAAVGQRSTVKLCDYLPADADVDNLLIDYNNYINIYNYILDNGEYKIEISGNRAGTSTLHFSLNDVGYSVPLNVLNLETVTIEATSGGSIDTQSVAVLNGTPITVNGNTLTIGTNTITATPDTDYSVVWDAPSEVPAGGCNIVAAFVTNKTVDDIHLGITPGGNGSSIYLSNGTYFRIPFSYTPTDAADAYNDITYNLSPNGAPTGTATVTGVSYNGHGTLYITVLLENAIDYDDSWILEFKPNSSSDYESIRITALAADSTFRISQPYTNALNVPAGQTLQGITYRVRYTPTTVASLTARRKLIFESSDPTIAIGYSNIQTNTQDGTMLFKVQGITPGECTLTYYLADFPDVKYTMDVTVTPAQ